MCGGHGAGGSWEAGWGGSSKGREDDVDAVGGGGSGAD